MSLSKTLIPTYIQMLTALSAWLAKAEEQRPGDDAALLSARLAPDMFPLATQVRFTCVQAWEGMYRLKGEDFPPRLTELLNEGRGADNGPGTIADARARIDETIALVQSMSGDSFDENPDRPIAHALPMGMIFDLSAEQYVRDWALPQFYFHVMAAYAILRAEGIALGKPDYVAHMFAHLRPGTMPAR